MCMLPQAFYLNAMAVAEMTVVCCHAADRGPFHGLDPLSIPVFMQDLAEGASVLEPFQKMLQFALEPLLSVSTVNMQPGLNSPSP